MTQQMERRLAALGSLSSWESAPEGLEDAWNAPYGPAEDWDVRAEDAELPGPYGPIPVRIYTPLAEADAPRPVLVWCHGGGFIHGDLDMPEADAVSRGVAGRAGAVVVSVDYLLCDDPFAGEMARRLPAEPVEVHAPVPRREVAAAVQAVRERAEELGIDPRRLALGGASAGGNLAAAASLQLAEQGSAPAASLLMYPVAHPMNPPATAEEQVALDALAPVLGFSEETMRVMSENYLGAPIGEASADDFPGLASAERLAVLPRTYIEADDHDDLRPSARRYAEQLREAGVDVELTVRRGVSHGHLNRVGLVQAAESFDRMAEIVAAL